MTFRRALVFAVAAALAAGSLLSGCSGRPAPEIKVKQVTEPAGQFRPPQPIKPKPIKKIMPAGNRIFTGVFDRNIVDGRTKFERAVGRDVAVAVTYQSWSDGSGFPRDLADQLSKTGKVLMVTWEPWQPSTTDWNQPAYRLSKIAAGEHDDYLKRWLTGARDLRKPVFVRFAHEMNGDWYPWGKQANTPAEYVAAWRHIVDLSRALGADNINWVWSPNELGTGDNLDNYYPGNEYVDWVGVSGFNWGGLESWQGWRSFDQIFGDTLGIVGKYNKPIMIAEVGSIRNPVAGQETRAAWITETLAEAKKTKPNVSMIIWFDGAFEMNNKQYDWVIDDDPASIKAMADGLADPIFLNHISY